MRQILNYLPLSWGPFSTCISSSLYHPAAAFVPTIVNKGFGLIVLVRAIVPTAAIRSRLRGKHVVRSYTYCAFEAYSGTIPSQEVT